MSHGSSLARAFERQIQVLATILRPATIAHYRYTARSFLGYLASFPGLGRADQLRRDPHIFGWMEQLWLQQPPLCASTRLGHLIRLRRLFDGLSDLAHPPRPGLVRSEDLPRLDYLLPRPLPVEDDARLDEHLRSDNDLLSNALLLLRGTGLRIGELADLAPDCLHHIDGPHWAIRVPVGKLHSERWVPVDDDVRHTVARLQLLRALPPHSPEELFLLPRPRGRTDLLTVLRQRLRAAAQRSGCSIAPVPHQLRHYAEFRTMPSKSRLMQRQPGMTAFARVQVVDELGIVQRTLQVLKKGQQLVVRPVST